MAAEKLSAALVGALLEKLSSDDDFRALFVKSPEAALAELGYVPVDKALSPAACLQVSALASKEQIRESREELRSTLSAILPKGGFGLEAG